MFELTFLGTSASAPSIQRSLPSLMIRYAENRFLVDCGEGTQRQILTSGLGFRSLNKILLTHGHLDHILGVAGLLSTMIRWESMDGIHLYGGRETLARVNDLVTKIVCRGTRVPSTIHFNEVDPDRPILETADFRLSCFPVVHRGTDSFGYIFERKSRRPFLPERAEALAIPPGPWRRELALGNSVTLPDGRVISGTEVLGDEIPGTRLVVVGDCGEPRRLVDIVRGADALVIEATYLEEDADMAKHYSHMTARMSAQLAKEAGVGQLFLTHVSRRYRDRNILREAAAVFPNTVVARDFDTFRVPKGAEDSDRSSESDRPSPAISNQ